MPAAVAAGLGTLAVVAGLVWPLPIQLADARPLSTFGDSHVWVFDHLYRAWTGQTAMEPTCRAGYPALSSFRAIAQGPAALAAALRIVLGPVAAANVVQLVSLPVSALAAAVLVRRWTGVVPLAAAALGVTWALCPTLLGTYATQEVSNTQAWILPIYLLLLAGRAWWTAGLAGVVALLAAFTSPYYALALPLLWGGGVVLSVVGDRAGLPRLALAGVCTAAGLWPARAYFDMAASGGSQSLFQPARRLERLVEAVPEPAPVADPLRLLWAGGPPEAAATDPQHAVYLGLALVLTAVGLTAWRRRWAARDLALVVGGALLCMGPLLAWGGSYTAAGSWLRLPVFWLEAAGYPTGLGGMYYRYAVLVALGLVLAVGRGLAGLPRAPWFAAALLAIQLGDGLRATGPHWPRPLAPIPDVDVLRGLEGEDGAVLVLPWQGGGDAAAGQAVLLEAALHGRPVPAIPRDPAGVWRPLRFVAMKLEERLDPTSVLQRKGVRYVLLRGQERASRRASLSAALGPPIHDGAFSLWDVGPAKVRCQTPPNAHAR